MITKATLIEHLIAMRRGHRLRHNHAAADNIKRVLEDLDVNVAQIDLKDKEALRTARRAGFTVR